MPDNGFQVLIKAGVLLADVQSTALEPLLRHLLLPGSDATARLWHTGRVSTIYLKDVI